MSMTMAGVTALIFNLQNLYARSSGGLISDFMNRRRGLRGRLQAQFICLFFEGVFLVAFSRMKCLASSLPMLFLFGFFVQASEGTTYGIVPYVSPQATGTIAGIVGAGGNIGAMCFGLIFIFSERNEMDCYMILGAFVMVISVLTLFLTQLGSLAHGHGFKKATTTTTTTTTAIATMAT